MAPRIIRKYEQFLKEAGPAPAAPPPIYQRMDMNQGSRADAPDTYKIDFSKDTKTPSDTNKIKGSDWGIEGFNPPVIERGFYKVPGGVRGAGKLDDPYGGKMDANIAAAKERDVLAGDVYTDKEKQFNDFIESYNDYIRQGDSTGLVGKKVLIFRTMTDKDNNLYVEVNNNTAKTVEVQSSYKGKTSFGAGWGEGLAIWTTRKATRQFDLETGQMAIRESAFNQRVKDGGPGGGQGYNLYGGLTIDIGNYDRVPVGPGRTSNRTTSDIRLVDSYYSGELSTTATTEQSGESFLKVQSGEVQISGTGDVYFSPIMFKKLNIKSNRETDDFSTTYTDQYGYKYTVTLTHAAFWSPAFSSTGTNIKFNPEGYGTEFHVKAVWRGDLEITSGVKYQNDSLVNINLVKEDSPNYKPGSQYGEYSGAGIAVPLETTQYGETLGKALQMSQDQTAKSPKKQLIVTIKWNSTTKKWEIVTENNNSNAGDFRVNGGYWIN